MFTEWTVPANASIAAVEITIERWDDSPFGVTQTSTIWLYIIILVKQQTPHNIVQAKFWRQLTVLYHRSVYDKHILLYRLPALHPHGCTDLYQLSMFRYFKRIRLLYMLSLLWKRCWAIDFIYFQFAIKHKYGAYIEEIGDKLKWEVHLGVQYRADQNQRSLEA